MSMISTENLGDVGGEFGEHYDVDNVKLDLHLNSPIRDTFGILFMDAIKIHPKTTYCPLRSNTTVSYCELPLSVTGPASELVSILDGKTRTLKLLLDAPFDVAHDIYNQMHSSKHRTSSWLPGKSKTIAQVLHDIIISYDARLLSEFDDPTGTEWDFDARETGLYVLKSFLEDTRDAICRLAEKKSNNWMLFPFPSKKYPVVMISRSIIMFMSGKIKSAENVLKITTASYSEIEKRFSVLENITMVNYEFFLCIQDTITSRLFTMYSQRLLSPKFAFHVNPDIVASVYKVFDKEIQTLGNKVFKQIKMFEAFVNAHVINKTNTISMKRDFRDYLENLAVNEDFSAALEMSELLDGICTEGVIELMGVFRHWGHPIVDEKAGCEKVKKIIKTRAPVDEKIMDEILGALNKQFVFEFISQMKRWPSCDVSKLGKDSPLKKMIDRNTKYINEYGNSVPLSEWALITISSELEFDYSIDYLDLVSDRAIAPWVTENQFSYNSAISGIKKRGQPSTHRRLLTEILDRRTISVEEICNMIRDRSLPAEWYNIKLSSKERELNEVPRLFAMMVLEMRLAYCVMEKNIAKKVFHFYPQQSMNMGEEKLSRRLINIATPREESTSIDLIIGIDFTSWNIHWSPYNTRVIARMVSQLFGLPNLYEFCHEFFSLCEVSLSSSLLVPEKYMNQDKPHLKLPEDQYVWGNHLGGLEGICQKLWTLITIGLLLVVESRTGIKSSIIGQGDNQVCKIQVPLNNLSYTTTEEKYQLNDEHIRSVKEKFMNTLTEVAESIGLKLKALESWVSDSTAQYSKDWLVRGAYQSQLLKRVCRTMPDVSEDYHTFPNRVSSLQSAGFSSAQKSYVMALPWFISQMETGLTLMRDLKIASTFNIKNLLNIMETSKFLRFFFLSDNCFTGIPLINLGEYEFRGHPDPLTTYLSTIYRMMTSPTCQKDVLVVTTKIWSWLIERKYPLGPASPEVLISNPTAVNIHTPSTVNYLFKQEVYSGLQSTTKNQDIKDMFNSVAPAYDEWFYSYLASTRPLYPRLLNVIMTHSPTGARIYTISKLANSKTVGRVTQGGVVKSLEDQIVEIDKNFYLHLKTTYEDIMKCRQTKKIMCPTQLADDIRSYGYKDLIKGDPIIGVTMPHPMHIMRYVYDDNTIGDGYISVLAPHKFDLSKLLIKSTQPPFVGTKTLEKVSGRVVTVSGKSRPFDDVCRLVQMLGWAIDEDSKLGDFVKELIRCRTNVPFEILEGMSGRNYIGSHIHRTSDPATKKDVRGNMRHSVTTHFAYSSDNLGITTRGGDDFNLQPSALFLHATREIIKEIIHTQGTFTYLRGYLSNGQCCMESYDNLPASIDIPGVAPTISVQNPLLYADIKDFQRIVVPDSCLVEHHTKIPAADAIGYYLMSRYKGIILTAILSYQDIKPPYLTRISMSEVMNIGVVNIIRSFAKYLYLYLESEYVDLRLNLSAMGPEVWCGIADLCLIPTVLPQICKKLRLDGTPDVYKTNNQIHRLLNELLIKEMDKIHKSSRRARIMKDIKFFVLDTVKFPNVLKMWWESICISYTVSAELRNKVFKLIRNMSKSKSTWGEALNQMMGFFKTDPTFDRLWEYIITEHKIKLMKQPPEFYFRTTDPKLLPPPEPVIAEPEYNISQSIKESIETLRLPIEDYHAKPSENDIISVTLDEMLIKDKTDIERKKTRMDQSSRLMGNLSTAWSKYIQIIIKYKIALHHPIICTADGESSVGIALSRYSGGQPIYFNSLQSRDIVTQRYESFVPGSFICSRDRIKAQDLSIIYGGDLTDQYYLNKFLGVIPSVTSLLTCDAETSGEFDPKIRVDIINSLLTIVSEKKPETCIIKDFMGNLKLLSATISAFQLYYYSVVVVVPHYSSFESLECFIVARIPRMTTVPPVQRDSLWVSRDYAIHMLHLGKIKDKKIQASRPFADSPEIVKTFVCLGEQLGFHSNFINSLYRITSIYPPNGLSVNELPEWLHDCKNMIGANIESLCRSFSSMIKGEAKVSRIDGAQLAMNPSCSRLMQQYSFSMLSISLLTAMISVTDIESAQQVISDSLNDQNLGLQVNNTQTYTLTGKDIEVWAKQHLKPLWRVWGHHHHRM